MISLVRAACFLAIFFLLFVLVLCIFLVHLMLSAKFHYIPESLAIGKSASSKLNETVS
jgi:hypothetical protein